MDKTQREVNLSKIAVDDCCISLCKKRLYIVIYQFYNILH